MTINGWLYPLLGYLMPLLPHSTTAGWLGFGGGLNLNLKLGVINEIDASLLQLLLWWACALYICTEVGDRRKNNN